MLFFQFCQHVDVCKEHMYYMEKQGKCSKRLKKKKEEEELVIIINQLLFSLF